MKSTFAMVLLLGIICTVVMAQKYPVKFDQVNIETVLSNDRVLSNYIKCLLDKGACTREGRELKSKCPVFLVWSEPFSFRFCCMQPIRYGSESLVPVVFSTIGHF